MFYPLNIFWNVLKKNVTVGLPQLWSKHSSDLKYHAYSPLQLNQWKAKKKIYHLYSTNYH